MTRKQMEAKIEELAAELAELKKNSCHNAATCVHYHYSYPFSASVAQQTPWQYQVYQGGATYQQLKTS